MELQEKEKYIAIISSGTIIYKHGGLKLYIKPPSSQLRHESYLYKDEILEDIQFDNLFTAQDLRDFLLNNEIISEDIDTIISNIQKNQELMKIEACENWMDFRRVDLLKRNLRSLDQQLMQLYSSKHCMDHLTKDGYAELCRINFLIINSVYDSIGNKIELDDAILIDKLATAYNSSFIPANILREIARTDPWTSVYASSQQIFNYCGTELTENQKNLLAYTRMYENIFKHQDAPNERIINDDDLLDGWLAIQRKQNKKTDTNDKYGNAQEVYLIAKDKNTIDNINGMNSQYAKNKKLSRLQQVKQKGRIAEFEFADVQQELRKQNKKG